MSILKLFKRAVIIAISLSVLLSCEKESIVNTVNTTDSNDSIDIDETTTIKRLSRSSINLAPEDALIVVSLCEERPITRSLVSNIKDVVTIPDEQGEPAIYAVNLDDGYILVSAYKTTPPILAEISHGSYSLTDEESALSFLIEELTNEVVKHKSDTLSKELKMLWSRYEEKESPQINGTRSYSTVWDAISAYMQMWRNEEYNVYVLHQQPPGLSNEEYAFLCEYASYYEREGYDYMYYSYITEKVIGTTLQKGPYYTTSWGAGYPYYATSSGSFDDATVAVGQLMKYYEYPNNYYWSLMPNHLTSTDTPNTYITSLLSSVESSLSTLQSSGQTKPNSVKNYLNTNYYASIASHNTASTLSALDDRDPFIMTGENSSGTIFAWCCDGYQKQSYHDEYAVWVIADFAYPDFDYEIANWVYNGQYTLYYYHINWGNNGNNDGWFILSDIDYSSNMKDIIVNGHR